MEQNKKVFRLHALDGLRGIAILLVFLSHIDTTYVPREGLLGYAIFGSGVIGVTFLFILSGFLMAFLYPQPKSKLQFIKKRYTRIFPLFLSVCTAQFILLIFPNQSWYGSLGEFLLLAFSAHVLWVYVVKRYLKGNKTKILFFSFIVLQVAVGIYYYWVMHRPPTFYYQQMPHTIQLLTDWLVNMTLMLPIGNYVNMLDPVYWSLAAEVLFYILYPFICAPIIAYMSTKNRMSKIILLLCLIPFFAAMTLLFQHILFLTLLRFQYFYYFVTGMTLGYLFRKYPKQISKFGNLFPGFLSYFTIFLFFGFIISLRLINYFYTGPIIWVELLLAIPTTLLVAIALSNKTGLAKLFKSRILVYLGTVSYSLYLSHMFILNVVKSIIKQPHSLPAMIFYILFSFIFSVAFSSILYLLLEKPYFKQAQSIKKAAFLTYQPNNYIPYLFSSLSLGILIISFFIFQSKVNFFTFNEPSNNSLLYPKTTNTLISLNKYPTVTLQIKAIHNNLGIVFIHLIHNSKPYKTFVPQHIEFKIRQKESTSWYATSEYTIKTNTEALPELFGFPPIVKSQGNTYIMSLSESVPKSSEYALLDDNYKSIGGIYMINKKNLLSNPQLLVSFIQNKFVTVLYNYDALQIFQFSLPFIFFSFYILIAKNPLGIFNYKKIYGLLQSFQYKFKKNISK